MSGGSVRGALRYSDAQVALFGTLGLVPWVRREDRVEALGTAVRASADDAAVDDASAVAIRAAAPPVEPAPAPAATPAAAGAAVPGESPDPGDWLGAQPLAGFARRGEQRHETGPEGSTVLVVAEASPDTVTLLPLEQRELDLLDPMMRSIGLAPGDWSTAVLADPARDGSVGANEPDPAPSVATLSVNRRALLWLVRDPGDDPSLDAHRFTVGGVPVFRVPHPATLLAHPSRKRCAWRVLKAVRNLLAGTGA